MDTPSDALKATMLAYEQHAAQYESDSGDLLAPEVSAFLAGLTPGAFILDAGCGPGRDLVRIRAAGFAALGVDLSPEFVRRAAASGAPASVADLRQLPFADATFDAVWACASLVHLDPTDTHTAMKELFRVTRDGGNASMSLKSSHAAAPGWQDTAHGRRWFHTWDLVDVCDVASTAGWRSVTTRTSGAFVSLRAVR